MAKLYCVGCKTDKDEKEFTSFNRNPKLKDRNGNCPFCKDCASKYVAEKGNTKEALKEILRLQDIPYLENFANTALDNYDKKIKNTNLVIKRNVHDETEEVSGIETTKHQNTIYTCYSSKLGLMPKKYVDFSFSDGVRGSIVAEPQIETPTESETDGKSVQSAIRFLTKTFTKEIFDDKERFVKAVELKCQELSLHKNNTNARQNKFKLKNHISTLVEAGLLVKEDYSFLYGEDEDNKPKNIMVVDTGEEDKEFKVPDSMDLEKLRERWGDEYKPQEMVKFEKKYLELRKNYEIKTASHDEFLRHACIASVKANECMARNQADESKVWFGIFKDMTSAGKLQPNQMSKADLSGGLNNFSEFYKTVEEARGVIDVMPTFKKQPHDDADFVIWCLIQYVRRLKGMPDVPYEAIWEFYEEMAQAYNKDDEQQVVNDYGQDEEEIEGDIDGE
jgi:hypothetical protein